MLERLKRLFGVRVEEKTLSQKLLSNILMPGHHKDYFRSSYGK
jgi:hypothetical protein